MIFVTLKMTSAGTIPFAEIAAPPMNLMGHELVRNLVSLIQRAEADETIKVSSSKALTQTTSFPTLS
jgi:hypothetical protein